MSLFAIKKYRNVYIKGYKKIPFQKLTGRNTIVYTDSIICGVDGEPDKYEKDKDLYINCECDFSEIRNFVKLKQR